MQAINLRRSLSRHCEERLVLQIVRQSSCCCSNNDLVTKQSRFTNLLVRVFHRIYKNLFLAKSEQGDCFAAEAEPTESYGKQLAQLRLAMTIRKIAMTGGVRYESC